jgi:5-formyltetrahydrofolate cyclo-ligase
VADDSMARAKQAIRERIWDLLEREHVTEPGVRGYIPAFAGAEIAASLLAGTQEWQAARVIKAVPDRAQQPVRERALRDGKLVYMAVPRLAEDPPFYELDPGRLPRRHPGRELRRSRAGSVPGRCARWTWWCAAAWQ